MTTDRAIEYQDNLSELSQDDKLDFLVGSVEKLRNENDKLLQMLGQFIKMVDELGSHPMFAAFKNAGKRG